MTPHALIAITLSITSIGCATTHFAGARTTPDQGIKLSCGEDSTFSTANYKALTCTLENRSTRWMDLEITEISVVPAVRARVLTPEEGHVYGEAIALKVEQDQHNLGMVLAGLFIAGETVSALAPDDGVAAAGEGLADGALAVAAIHDAKAQHDSVQHSWLYGPEHLAGGRMQIPGGLFIRRKLILERTYDSFSKYPLVAGLKVCFRDHGCVEVGVPL